MAESNGLLGPGTEAYRAATAPDNSSGSQRPAFVAQPHSPDDVASVVQECARRGLILMPQATGHGAGGDIGSDTVIVDTSGFDALSIDRDARVATAGAGLTWGRINPEAEKSGLLGRAGSSPTVSISGYTFGGGVGWLSRPHGMAAGALRRVDYVTGAGELRSATDDAADEIDREAIYAFRGGGGVGIATEIEFDLVAVTGLHAGYLLWTVDHLEAVVAAWAEAMSLVSADVATSVSVLHLPPAPPFPEQLRGTPVVHLAVAASAGESGALPLLERVRAAARPEVDTWGPADAQKLAQIHLDPPSATPAIGDARWLNAATPSVAADIISVAAPDDSPLALIEIRSVGNDDVGLPGAQTNVPGPYVFHAVAPLKGPDSRPAIDAAFAGVEAAAAPADAGRAVGSWMEGATSVPDALPAPVRARVTAAADLVDPAGVIRRNRFLT